VRRLIAAILLLPTVIPVAGVAQTAAGNSDDYFISTNLEVVDPSAQVYLKFFTQVKDVGKVPLSPDASTSLGGNESEMNSLLAVTADLAAQSWVFAKELKPLVFEARMQIVESDAVSAALQKRIDDLGNRWSQAILDHAQRLKSSWGEARFHSLDEFIHSGKPLFESAVPKTAMTLNGVAPK